MGSLFKPKFKRYFDSITGKIVTRNHPRAVLGDYQSEKWYGRYRDHLGVVQRVPLHKNKDRSRERLVEIEREVDDRKHGRFDRFAQHRITPLSDHREKFREHLKARGRTLSHVNDTIRYVRLVCEHCGFVFLPDITADAVNHFANTLRDTPPPPRSKKKPEQQSELGRSARTVNAYTNAIKQFCHWCVATRRAPDNPLAHLDKLNEQVDPRLERRTLSKEELALLVAKTRESSEVFRRLDGADRAMLYLTAVKTGLRASELASLTRRSLELGDNSPALIVEARDSKRRRRDRQPIPSWLNEELEKWLSTKTISLDPSAKLWSGAWHGHGAEMLRLDLERAGIPYKDAEGRVFDFHSFRHQYITTLVTGGIHPRLAQELARHSSPELTMKRYTHLNVFDVDQAVDVVSNPLELPVKNQVTGTDGNGVLLRSCCATDGNSSVKLASSGKMGKKATKNGGKPYCHGV